MFYQPLLDGPDPGANMGIAFTADIADRELIPQGKYIDHLRLTLQGAVSTAAVTLESFVALLNQFNFKVGAETRIQLNGQDLIALSMFYYDLLPKMWENTDNTGFDFIEGIKIPIQETVDTTKKYSFNAKWATVTNIATSTLGLGAMYLDDSQGRKPLVIQQIPYTTAGATGYTNALFSLPQIGKLVGLMIYQTTVPTDSAIKYDIQRLQLVQGGVLTSKFPLPQFGGMSAGVADGTLSAMNKLFDNYSFIDFRDEPVDLTAAKVEFICDVETVSEATRFIAIIQKV